MRKINVWLLRHGKTEGAAALNGQFDAKVPVTTQQEIHQKLHAAEVSFSTIISSPLSRCLSLGKLISDSEHKTLRVHPDLGEMNFGVYDGVPFDRIPQDEWGTLDRFWQDPQANPLPEAETLEHFYHRISVTWEGVISGLDQDLLIITHGGVIRMILANVLGFPWNNASLFTRLTISNQSLTHFEIVMDRKPFVTVKSIGVTL
ncbi:histidine phosphatase family protein [Vibrio salinus]|uniref:histidine phosphatase family protein n=1 Tax=Vibrio salinus TaxID=2899784 RepID=UPI001E35044D|nr:histidine phosphatase family protein [Vibrio salinus]MCE0496303.1 histidine phosphatase family protein [Vibrio salinus]